jgi:hypothetical protein
VTLPVTDRRPVGATVEFAGESGQRDDLARLPSLGEEVVDPGAVGLEYLRVEQGVGGHEGGVDLLGSGAWVVRPVCEEQVDV